MKRPVCALGSQPLGFCPNRSLSRNVDDCENKSLAITDLLRELIPGAVNKVLHDDDDGDDADDDDYDDDDGAEE